jgi:predicted FMN-binding regulatory protein PaiB
LSALWQEKTEPAELRKVVEKKTKIIIELKAKLKQNKDKYKLLKTQKRVRKEDKLKKIK